MRRSRLATGLVLTVALLTATASAAVATHEDVIPEPIPSSDVTVALETIADGFTSPVWAINAPRDGRRIFVVDQIGKIWAIGLAPGVPARHLFLDVGVTGQNLLVPLGAFGPGTFDERGLLGLAFHPQYQANGLFYTYTSEPARRSADFSTMSAGVAPNHQTVIRAWKVMSPGDPEATPNARSRVLMRIDQPQFNHNAGALVFGPNDHLFIAVGDGGAADDQGDGHAEGGNGQDLSDGNVLGKILRIDPLGNNSANGRYGIPADNPFVGADGADEIYAYGFRNPYRISFDRTGVLYAADVGQNDIEEVDVVVSGGNYGWPVKEGSFLFDMNGDDPGFTTDFSPGVPAGMIDPIAEYDHDEGISVTGGFVMRSPSVPGLNGDYVFGDWFNPAEDTGGRLLHIDDGTLAEVQIVGQDGVGMFVTGFGQDRRGNVYVLGQAGFAPVGETGVIQKIVAAE